jgi:outer membrane lipoprotein-sorting protein
MAMLGEKMSKDLATGLIHFRPPYSLRIQQETPRAEAVITDGNTLWWYIPQKEQVYQYPSHRAGQELRLLSDIFQGLRKVEESFIVVLSGLNNEKEYQLKLTPDPPWSQIEQIHLSVKQSDFRIRIVEITNYLGSITRFILGDLTVQKQFEEGFFRFVVPDGVKVMEEGG